jgi:hypothetical protein
VNGSSGEVIVNQAQTSIYGGYDTVFATSGSSVNLNKTDDNWDTVYGYGASVALDAAQASIFGVGNIVTETNGSSISLYNTNGGWDSVSGSSEGVTLVSSQTTLVGSHNNIYFEGTSALSLDGSSEYLSFGATLGQANVSGFNSSDTVHLSVADWSSYNALLGSGDLSQQGSNAVISLDASNRITLVNEQISALSSAQFSFS